MEPSSPATPEDAPAPAKPQPALSQNVRFILWGAWFSFVLLTALPCVVTLVALGLLVLWLGATWSLLHTGGLSMAHHRFDEWWNLGLLLTLTCLVGAVWRRVATHRKPVETRERVIGPGGRVLRVILRRAPDGATTTEDTSSMAAWIPDAGVMIGLFVLVVRWGEWGGNRWIPDGFSVVLIAANLYLFLLYVPLWLFRTCWQICWGMMRLGRGSEFRAGAFTVLFLLPVLIQIVSLVAASDVRPGTPQVPDEQREPFSDLESPNTFAAANRILLRATAEAFAPEKAFDADLRRYLRPWFDAGHTLREGVDYVWGLRDTPPSEAWELWQPRRAWAQSPDSDDPFQKCVKDLYPGQVSRAERQVRSKYRIPRGTSYDVTVGALVAVCTAHQRVPYSQLVAAFWRSVANAALKQIDPNRRYRREVPQSALDSDSIDCADRGLRGDVPRACPSPWSRPDEQVEAWERLSLIEFCALTRPQRTILLQKGLLGFSDQELADEHSNLTPNSAKVLYQNIRAKVKTKLDGMCRTRRGIDDLLDPLPSRRSWGED